MANFTKTLPRNDVTTYRLRCILYFQDGRPGRAMDSREIEAEDSEHAIALARLYVPTDPAMELLSATLSAPTGILFWSLRSEVLSQGNLKPSSG